MRTHLPSILTIVLTWGFTSTAAIAASCDPLTQDEMDLLGNVVINIPLGEVPIIQRCDTNGDNVVDIRDIRAISQKRNQPAAHPDDPMDWDKNQVINVLDARGCQQVCTLARCGVSEPLPELPEEVPTENAQCAQSDDLDGDGEVDQIAVISENTDDDRGGEWTLELVIVSKDDSGNTLQVTYPYAGQKSVATVDQPDGTINQHLSKQPAGTINLNPGTVTIEKPAVVSYRYGEPAVIYYEKDGRINRAYYGIND